MIAVRMPNGTRLTFNGAHFVHVATSEHPFHWLSTAERGGKSVALAPVDCIIEFEEPCSVRDNPTTLANQVTDRVDRLQRLVIERLPLRLLVKQSSPPRRRAKPRPKSRRSRAHKGRGRTRE